MKLPCVSSVVSVCAIVGLVRNECALIGGTAGSSRNSHTFRASSPSPPTRGSAVGRLHRKTSELEKEAKISLDEKGDVRKVSAAIASTLSSSPRIAEYGLQLLLSGLEHFTLSEAGGGGAGGGGGGIDDGSSPRGGAEEIAQLRAENEQLRARIMQLEVRLL